MLGDLVRRGQYMDGNVTQDMLAPSKQAPDEREERRNRVKARGHCR